MNIWHGMDSREIPYSLPNEVRNLNTPPVTGKPTVLYIGTRHLQDCNHASNGGQKGKKVSAREGARSVIAATGQCVRDDSPEGGSKSRQSKGRWQQPSLRIQRGNLITQHEEGMGRRILEMRIPPEPSVPFVGEMLVLIHLSSAHGGTSNFDRGS